MQALLADCLLPQLQLVSHALMDTSVQLALNLLTSSPVLMAPGPIV